MARRRIPAAERKAMQLGLEAGLTKRQLDLANVYAKARYGFGVGVLVMEGEKARAELAKTPWWRPFERRRWRREAAHWDGRLRTVTEHVAVIEQAR